MRKREHDMPSLVRDQAMGCIAHGLYRITYQKIYVNTYFINIA